MNIKYLIPLILIFALFSNQAWAPPTSSGKKEKEKMDRNLGRQESSDEDKYPRGAQGGASAFPVQQPSGIQGISQVGGRRLIISPGSEAIERDISSCNDRNNPNLKSKIKIGKGKSCTPGSDRFPFFYKFFNENTVPVYILVKYTLSDGKDWGNKCLYIKRMDSAEHYCEYDTYAPGNYISAKVLKAIEAR